MIKDNYRDYAVEAFRFYAGIDGDEELCKSEAEMLDVRAVAECLDELDPTERGVLEFIYMQEPNNKMARNDISLRVQNASFKYNMSVSFVYRVLREARLSFAIKRGLRFD